MRRRLLPFFSAVLLLLSVAVCGMWVRSYWRADVIVFQPAGRIAYGIGSKHGAIVFGWATDTTRGAPSWRYEQEAPDGSWEAEYDLRLGFGFSTGHSERLFFLPHASMAALTSIATAALYVRHRRQRRRGHAGHCLHCGYDLRATPDRCPECGRATQEGV